METWCLIIISDSIIAGLAVLLAAFRSYIVKKINKEPKNSPENYLLSRGLSGDTKTRVVVCVGDSITYGTVSFNYVDLLSGRKDLKGFTFVNAGSNSFLTYNVL